MFYMSLVASIITGIGSALGEGTILGFLKLFPGNGISYYGSGTGFAGITGAMIFIALKPLGISDGGIYLVALPTFIPYYLCFLWLNGQRKLYPYVPQEEIEEKIAQKAAMEIASDEFNKDEPVAITTGLDNRTVDTSNTLSPMASTMRDAVAADGEQTLEN